MMTPPQPPDRSASTGSICISGTFHTLWPRAISAAAVRSAAGSGRVTRTYMIGSIKEPGAGILLECTAGIGADGRRARARAGDRGLMRFAAIRLHDQTAEMQHAARQRGVAADRRLAGAVERGEEGALAGNRRRGIGM